MENTSQRSMQQREDTGVSTQTVQPLQGPTSVELDAAHWSIAEVERETGLGKDVLRVWERRYGFPVPDRDARGERRYPVDQLQRLKLIRRLLDADRRPNQIVALSLTELQALLNQSADGHRSRPTLEPAESAVRIRHQLCMQWILSDQTVMLRQAMQQQILRGGLSDVVEGWVAPLCKLVGEAWMRGDISVYQEHLFTETVQSVLREAIAAVDSTMPEQRLNPRVLLTTTPGEAHGLGLLMVESHLAMEGCVRFTLGTSTPLTDIAQAVNNLQIDVLVLSFSANTVRRDIQEHLQWLSEQLPAHVEIWVGGRAAEIHRRVLPQRPTVFLRPAEVSARIQAWRAKSDGGQDSGG